MIAEQEHEVHINSNTTVDIMMKGIKSGDPILQIGQTDPDNPFNDGYINIHTLEELIKLRDAIALAIRTHQ